MNRIITAAVITLLGIPAGAQDTEFSYQGELLDDGGLANGQYNMDFTLWDAPSGGGQIGSTLMHDGVRVNEGRFAVGLDWGAAAFDNAPRWLEIEVNGVRLSPRTEITRSPYSIQTRGIFVDDVGRVGIGTGGPQDQLHVRANQATVRLEDDNDPNSFSELMDAQPTQLRVNKVNSAGSVFLDLNPKPADGASTGLVRFFRETDTSGVKGLRLYRGNNTAELSGVIGVDGANSYFQAHGGNLGIGTSSPNARLSIVGDGAGTVLRATNGGPGGTAIIAGDVTGDGRAASFYGVTSNDLISVVNDGSGKAATFGGDVEFLGGFVGVRRDEPISGAEVFGITRETNSFGGMYAHTFSTGKPFYGYSAGGDADAYHYFDGADNRWKLWAGGDRLQVSKDTGNMSVGSVPLSATRLYADGNSLGGNNVGVYGFGRWGVRGHSSSGGRDSVGVRGSSSQVDGVGVHGIVTGGGANAAAIFGEAVSGQWAGYFSGDVLVTGGVIKGSGSFKIDHPLDPENKYLSHSFVESPDMMNVYNGNVVTDRDGYATVTLPEYFEALNRDYRYQLTVIDGGEEFTLAKVAEEIEDGRFVIRTSAPATKVSWQITGIRQDPYARTSPIVVETDKLEHERGKYLHPKAYGRPTELGLMHRPEGANR